MLANSVPSGTVVRACHRRAGVTGRLRVNGRKFYFKGNWAPGGQSDGTKFSPDTSSHDHLLAGGLLSRERVAWGRGRTTQGTVSVPSPDGHQNLPGCLFKNRFQPHIRSTESKSSRLGLENLYFCEAHQADCSRLRNYTE